MHNNQRVKIYNEKYSKLDIHCVTLKNIFDNQFKETEYTDVIYINCSDKNGKSLKLTIYMSWSLKIPLIVLIFS